MTLTRRGWLVGGGVVAATAWGFAFGIPALNAVVVPGIIAMAAAWVLVRRAEDPTIDRSPVEPAPPGERRVVTFAVEHPTALAAHVVDECPAHVQPAGGSSRHPVTDGHATYEIVSDTRGIGRLGPVEVCMRDPLGLFERTRSIDATTEVVTYPSTQKLAWPEDAPALLAGGAPASDRHAFDRLREYDPGDPLRDVHWRSSAKRPANEFIVKEFVADSDAEAVVIAGASGDGRADELARAAASVACWLLRDGIAVGLELRDVNVPVAAGPRQRRRVLRALAETSGGGIDPAVARDATITIRAEGDGPPVIVGGTDAISFDRVRDADRLRLAPDGGIRQ